jgi:small subunit ribosomal protein S27e
MKRSREPIPKSRSGFLLVKCRECGEERPIYTCSTKNVGCRGCGKELVHSRGGRAVVDAEIVKRLD